MGGRGQQQLKMSQLKLSQLTLRGGRVKSIETMSQNMQFFFFGGFPKLGYLLLCIDEMIFPLKLGESKLWSLNHFVS